MITPMAVAMIGETSSTLAGTIIVSVSVASRPGSSTCCSATSNCTACYPPGASTASATGRMLSAAASGRS